mmetsp:Transcript_31478/g.91552  ORF Transcript_31478/g.91552 Transcript_31478/m.91552 type:complete len:205 (-) Transcript_31478:612-1226(-)
MRGLYAREQALCRLCCLCSCGTAPTTPRFPGPDKPMHRHEVQHFGMLAPLSTPGFEVDCCAAAGARRTVIAGLHFIKELVNSQWNVSLHILEHRFHSLYGCLARTDIAGSQPRMHQLTHGRGESCCVLRQRCGELLPIDEPIVIMVHEIKQAADTLLSLCRHQNIHAQGHVRRRNQVADRLPRALLHPLLQCDQGVEDRMPQRL